MNAICFDIEATDNGEMLELSVYAYPDKNEIYHSYYKPPRARRWPISEKVHHITPEMVADKPLFKAERRRVQQIVDAADILIGFSVDNDIKYLKDNGISIADSKRVLDVRNLYELIHGKSLGVPFGNMPGLGVCAENIGIPFTEEAGAHSAGNDTLKTLDVMDLLLTTFNGGRVFSAETVDEVNRLYDETREEYLRESARGYISLEKCGDCYRMKNNREPRDRADYSIEVASRYIAEHELRERFAKRQKTKDSDLYRLTADDIKFFQAYTNEYDEVKERLYKMYGNDGRKSLSFHL